MNSIFVAGFGISAAGDPAFPFRRIKCSFEYCMKMMSTHRKISRKKFLKAGTGLVFGVLAWIWYRLAGYQELEANAAEFVHPEDLPQGMTYWGKYYLYRSGASVRAFSTTCTHAGCRLGKGTGELIRCNCHGSQFDAKTGKPVKGPAYRNLQEYRCRFDAKNKQWIVSLTSGGNPID